MRKSSPENWRKLWTKRDIDEVYPTSEVLIENLIETVDITSWRILEVGAGSGRDSVRLAKMGAKVHVMDYIIESLEVTRALARREKVAIHFLQADALALPIKADSFNIVFHQGLLEHFRAPQDLQLLQENYRVLKPNGLALVDVPQTFHIYTIIKQILIIFNKWFAGWEKQFTIAQLRSIMRQAGFTEEHAYGEWMYPSLFYRICRELLWKIRLANLPLYPPKIPVLTNIRKRIRQKLYQRECCKWTFYAIGVIGKKEQMSKI